MKKCLKQGIGVLVIISMLLICQTCVYAASKANPLTSASLTTATATASMNIGTDTADLDIMFVSSQVNKTDASRTWHPQQFSSKSSTHSLTGSKSAKSGYIFVNCEFSFYVNDINMGTLRRYV